MAAFLSAPAQQVQGLSLEYRKQPNGGYQAVLHNRRTAAVTAYIAFAAFSEGGRERRTALGGDSLGFTNGAGTEIPASSEYETGNSLPPQAVPGSSRIMAAIYADGVTEGEDEVVAMLLSGRQRALGDLKESLPVLERAGKPQGNPASLVAVFEAMQTRDQAEAARLDEIVDAPGRMRYRYFMAAVPMHALEMLSRGAPDPAAMLSQFRDWSKRLGESKPNVR